MYVPRLPGDIFRLSTDDFLALEQEGTMFLKISVTNYIGELHLWRSLNYMIIILTIMEGRSGTVAIKQLGESSVVMPREEGRFREVKTRRQR